MEEIYFEQEAKEKLFNGIEKLYKAVSSTMGPNGKTVVILDEYNNPTVTKDGVSVARSVSFKDSVENIGAQLIKQAAEKTLNTAGDGTTTATVLAYSFIKNLSNFNIIDVNKAFDEIIPKVIKQLKLNSRELKNEDIKYVASVSANNDIQIGELIQHAFDFSKIVKVEESNNNEDKLETIEGMQLDTSYFSKHFVNTEKKGEVNFTRPNVLIVDGKIEKLDNLAPLIGDSHNNGQELLIICDYISETALKHLETNKLSLGLKICVIKSPGFSTHRKDLLKDISRFTGATIISVSDLTRPITNTTVFGRLESCKISKNNSLLIKSKDIDLEDYIFTLESFRDSDIEKHDKELLNQRIEGLKAKVSLIKVGGTTELEMKERKDRIDDAVLAVACALEEGIVAGGGVALYKIFHNYMDNNMNSLEPLTAKEILERTLLDSLGKPMFKIIENGATINHDNNMFDLNIIDPLKVTRCALENAVSVAKTILSTDTVVLNQYLWKQ